MLPVKKTGLRTFPAAMSKSTMEPINQSLTTLTTIPKSEIWERFGGFPDGLFGPFLGWKDILGPHFDHLGPDSIQNAQRTRQVGNGYKRMIAQASPQLAKRSRHDACEDDDVLLFPPQFGNTEHD